MSVSAILYLLGLAAVFLGERLAEGISWLRWTLDVGGVLLLGGSAALRTLRMRDADDPGLEKGHRTALALTAVGAGSLLLYVLSTEATASALGLGAESAKRWTGSWGALWPIVCLCGTLPLLVVDRAVWNSPEVAAPRRIREALQYGLTAALGIALVFPVNYLAVRHQTRWNLSYFKTAQAGSSTRATVESLKKPIHVYAFFPPTSEVAGEVETYFEPLQGSKLTFHALDQTAHPRLARRLEVRENGRIAFTNRKFDPGSVAAKSDESDEDESDDFVVETLEIPTKLDEAKSDLEKLDRLVKKHLTKVSQGKRVAYLTTGHGEFSTDSGANRERRLTGFEKVLEATGFQVETVGLSEGLAEGVPEDADLVAVLGPSDSFLDSEVDALRTYLERGGALLVALEPEYARRDRTTIGRDDPLRKFLGEFGTSIGEGVLAAKRSIVPVANNKTDRLNVVTDRFSSHPSTATLSDASAVLFTPTSGHLETTEVSEIDRTITVRSRPTVWVDANENLEFDKQEGEEKKSRPVVAALKREATEDRSSWRALVSADATLFSDLALGNRGNQQFVYDTAQWLVGTPNLAGSVNSEEDVRIRHTKEGQAAWFYGTVLGVPLLLFAAGAFRIWRRRQGGES